MIKLFLTLNVFGENLLKNYDGKDATFEILGMLFGAFALGYLLRHLIGFRKKEYIIEQGDFKGDLSSADFGDLNAQIGRLKSEIDRLAGLKTGSVSSLSMGSEKLALTPNPEKSGSKKDVDAKTDGKAVMKSEVKNDTSKEKSIDAKTEKSKSVSTKSNDLKVIEGIGPALEKLLNENQIFSYDHLANKKVSELEEILDKAGPRFRVHVPETWPEQASLLRDGKTDAFKALTERLKGGRRV